MRAKQYLILPDLHIPFHNKKLVSKVCQLARDTKPDGLVILGDFGDYRSVSRHNKGSLGRIGSLRLSDEYAAQNKVLNDLCTAVGHRADKHFLYGNHEDSVNRWFDDGDNAKMGGAVDLPYKALMLERRGFKFYTRWNQDRITLGSHLALIHGEFTPIHCAKKHLDEMEGSVMHGHCHRVQVYATGKRAAYSIGWLGDETSPAFHYAAWQIRAKWLNAFSMVSILDDGDFIPQLIQCWNSRFAYNGKLY